MRAVCCALAVVWGCSAVMLPAAEPEVKASASASVDREQLEKEFAERLSGAALVGTFTVDGRDDRPPRPERYEISSVQKLQNDHWLFVARVKYNEKDVRVPMSLPVVWAGDTPIITLTDLAIPGLGTYTARVMIYGDRYAGTWQHDNVGGHMWGRIEKLPAGGDASRN